MPPKRKRADDAATEATPRATRTSSRLKTATSTSSTQETEGSSAPKAKTKATKAAGDGVTETEPAHKKAKKTRAKAPTGTQVKSQAKQTETGPNASSSMTTSNGTAATSSQPAAPAPKKDPAKPEPYSEVQARELFKKYQDPDTPGEIGPEGFETLCEDLDVSLEGALPLVLAWQLHATEMAKLKESEWMQGTAELRISDLQSFPHMLRDLEDLLLFDKPPLQPNSSSASVRKKGAAITDPSYPYNRQKYFQYAADKNKAFGELYAFCFALAKPLTARNIDIDTASAFWSVLVAPKYHVMKDIVEFISEKGSYKGVNKDLWNMVIEFCRTMRPDLSNFEADGAWPTFLDDFVAWKKSKSTESEPKAGAAADV